MTFELYFYSALAVVCAFELSLNKSNSFSKQWPEALSNMTCALLVCLSGLLLATLTIPILVATMNVEVGLSLRGYPFVAKLFVGLLVLDFFSYWFHRLQHVSPIFWLFHETHHQATNMNVSVALRQSAFSVAITWVVIIPLILTDMDWQTILWVLAIHKSYDALMHIGKSIRFGFLETILVSPALHRVHHGYSKQYVNKNFANVFIFYDRIFKTFNAADDLDFPIGLNEKGEILSPIEANISPFKTLLNYKKLSDWVSFSNQNQNN